MCIGGDGECGGLGPPPDTISSMPPPPLPSFLLPTTAIVALSGNNSQPCFTPFICEPSGNREDSDIKFIDLGNKNQLSIGDTWLFVIVSLCVGIILLGVLLAILLMKCRDKQTTETVHGKRVPMEPVPPTINMPNKSNNYMGGTLLYPTMPHNAILQQQMAHDNRLLWATLTPHGTKHFITKTDPIQDDHYEVIEYGMKTNRRGQPKRHPNKSFDNNGFMDYDDYEDPDPSPLMDSYQSDDIDSGYQEPHDVISTLNRNSPRPLISSPTRIENPNIPPINYYPHRNMATWNRKGTLSRKTYDPHGATNI